MLLEMLLSKRKFSAPGPKSKKAKTEVYTRIFHFENLFSFHITIIIITIVFNIVFIIVFALFLMIIEMSQIECLAC